MEKVLTPEQAWINFWEWIRQPEQAKTWQTVSRKRKQYLYKAEIDRKVGKLGYVRIKNILKENAPGRYEFREQVILNT